MSEIADAARATKEMVNAKRSLLIAEGVVSILGASKVASVTGIAGNPIQVDSSNWLGAFKAAVAAGSVNGRRVLVLFADRQAYISDVVG